MSINMDAGRSIIGGVLPMQLKLIVFRCMHARVSTIRYVGVSVGPHFTAI